MTQESTPQTTQTAGTTQPAAVTGLRFEHHPEALGIGEARPRLSWQVKTSAPGWMQSAYEVEALNTGGQPGSSTGKVESSESVLVEWPFAPLQTGERVSVRVRAWGSDGQPTAWSEPEWVEAGLLDHADWNARFVTPDWDEDTSQPQPGPLMRRAFDVKPGVKQARLYITALGVYEPYLNGEKVGDHVLAPGWTSYKHRLRYQTFDVTAQLREGRNALGAMLGDGWYRGRLSFGGGRRNIYGDRLALLAQLEIVYEDGTTEQVITDQDWRAARGPVQAADIYDGESYDARQEQPGWNTPGFDDSGWVGVRPLERDLATLFAPSGPPVRRIEVLAPDSISQSPSGKTIVDFGQNLVGWLRITVSGPAGLTITFQHAEVLENGELSIRPLRSAKATDQYTLRGEGEETWEPRFTFHGFRYAQVDNWPGDLQASQIRAVVCHSDMERTGWFECSEPLLNRLHENVVWGMRGNFLDIPTDCPQRDERLGWTGDIQVFSPTASFLYDAAGFLSSWLADLAAEQKELGVVPFVVPSVTPPPIPPAAAWGDAAVVVPWVLYQRYGDKAILERQFESMKAWVDLIAEKAGETRLWDTGFQFGDWLDPSAPPDNPAAARTPGYVVATAYLARSAEINGQAARLLGKKEAEDYYLGLAAEVRKAFCDEYVTPNGRMISDAATAYSLAIQFALLPGEDQRRRAGERLAELARTSGYRISTGFVGTPLICDALCSVGQHKAAYRLLTQRECPSWLYSVTMGATTIWERWDSLLPDGSVNPGEMTSFNHYALGAVADWMHRTVAGLAPAEPGYRRLEIRPTPGGGLEYARARHKTPYGTAESSWALENGKIKVEVTVPANSTALVTLPGSGEQHEVSSGKHQWEYEYQDPRASRPPITLDSSFYDLIEDEEAYALVVKFLKERLPHVAERMGGSSPSFSSMAMRQLFSFIPGGKDVAPDLEAELAKLYA
jgi:alpha-L-rhamnosidase